MNTKWLYWAQKMQSISQAGIEYSKDPYDVERFEQLRNLSAEIVSEYTEIDMEKVIDLFSNETGYQTPKIDVRASIIKDDKILLVQENDGEWALPGGWAEPHLSIKENTRKEVMEEAGVEIIPEEIIAVLDRNRHTNDNYPYSVYKIFIQCTFLSGSFRKNIETIRADFFDKDDLPVLSAARISQEQIDICFQHLKDKDRKIIFD